jgi:hypothetical protein
MSKIYVNYGGLQYILRYILKSESRDIVLQEPENFNLNTPILNIDHILFKFDCYVYNKNTNATFEKSSLIGSKFDYYSLIKKDIYLVDNIYVNINKNKKNCFLGGFGTITGFSSGSGPVTSLKIHPNITSNNISTTPVVIGSLEKFSINGNSFIIDDLYNSYYSYQVNNTNITNMILTNYDTFSTNLIPKTTDVEMQNFTYSITSYSTDNNNIYCMTDVNVFEIANTITPSNIININRSLCTYDIYTQTSLDKMELLCPNFLKRYSIRLSKHDIHSKFSGTLFYKCLSTYNCPTNGQGYSVTGLYSYNLN